MLGGRTPDCQQFVQQHAQRVDIAACVDVQPAHLGLFGAHVQRSADHLGKAGKHRPLGELLTGRLGHSEVDDLWHRSAIVQGDQHVGWFQIAVNNSFGVCMLDRLADEDKQFQSFIGAELAVRQ